MRTDAVMRRLAAANPYPNPSFEAGASAVRTRHRSRPLLAALAVVVIAVPSVAMAGGLDGLFGFSTQGQPVATQSTPFSEVSGLNEAMSELDFPTALQLVATRDGISFYAARRTDGRMCVAVDASKLSTDGGGEGVGCDLGNPSLPGEPGFPSAARPIFDFSRAGTQLAGFAADGVASVRLLDASGNVLASAPVSENVYADASVPAGGTAVEALDSSGAVIYRHVFGQNP